MKPIEHPISFSWASNVETLPSPQGGLLYLTATGLTSWKPLRAFHRLGLRLGRCPPQETLHDQCLAPNHERSILEQVFITETFGQLQFPSCQQPSSILDQLRMCRALVWHVVALADHLSLAAEPLFTHYRQNGD